MWTNCRDIARFSIMAGTNLPRPKRYPDTDPYGLAVLPRYSAMQPSTSPKPEAKIAANLEQPETGPGRRLDISNQPAPSGSGTVPLQTRLAKKRGTGGRLSAAVFDTGENLDPGGTSDGISEECDSIPWGPIWQSQHDIGDLLLLTDTASGRPSLSIFDTAEQLIPCATDAGTEASSSDGGIATSVTFEHRLMHPDRRHCGPSAGGRSKLSIFDTGEQHISCADDAGTGACSSTGGKAAMNDAPYLHMLADAASKFEEDPHSRVSASTYYYSDRDRVSHASVYCDRSDYKRLCIACSPSPDEFSQADPNRDGGSVWIAEEHHPPGVISSVVQSHEDQRQSGPRKDTLPPERSSKAAREGRAASAVRDEPAARVMRRVGGCLEEHVKELDGRHVRFAFWRTGGTDSVDSRTDGRAEDELARAASWKAVLTKDADLCCRWRELALGLKNTCLRTVCVPLEISASRWLHVLAAHSLKKANPDSSTEGCQRGGKVDGKGNGLG
ncbi:hypothetical protein DFH06DRAFT_1145364 [Mycena polygramma]|nr:hypothetical protein DFH06DRAFT_1145364 [Mycena polygramma]